MERPFNPVEVNWWSCLVGAVALLVIATYWEPQAQVDETWTEVGHSILENAGIRGYKSFQVVWGQESMVAISRRYNTLVLTREGNDPVNELCRLLQQHLSLERINLTLQHLMIAAQSVSY